MQCESDIATRAGSDSQQLGNRRAQIEATGASRIRRSGTASSVAGLERDGHPDWGAEVRGGVAVETSSGDTG